MRRGIGVGTKRKGKKRTQEKPDPNIIPFADLLTPIPPVTKRQDLIRQLREQGGGDPRTEGLIRKIESGEMT